MLENYQTMYKQAVDAQAPEYIGGFGHYRHYSEPFTPDNKDIVTPNNDTPYSWAWLDLRAEPWVLSVPAVPKDRYYVCQWFDLFTHNFAYVGVARHGIRRRPLPLCRARAGRAMHRRASLGCSTRRPTSSARSRGPRSTGPKMCRI